MKDSLTQIISHGFKWLIGAAVAFLVGHSLLSAEDAKALEPQTAAVITTTAGFVATILAGVAQTKFGKYFPRSENNGSDANGSGGNLASLLCMMAAVSTLLLLPSCGGLAEYPITGSVFVRDPESGAKGGLTFTPGKTTAWGLVAIRDPETGEITSYVDISAPLNKATVTPDK